MNFGLRVAIEVVETMIVRVVAVGRCSQLRSLQLSWPWSRLRLWLQNLA
jgi:hypothetical protein